MTPHEEWLLKAENDLKSAIKLNSGNDPITDTAIYHTQQCAEKSLKAYLAYNDYEIDKTHQLKTLLNRCISINSDFDKLIPDANFLSPFATLYRYPDEVLFPEKEDVDSAIVKADNIFRFVKSLIIQ